MREQIVSIAALSALLALTACAQTGAHTLADTDQAFMRQAAQANVAEISAGRLAAERATSPAVQDFARRMVADHYKSYDQLKELGREKDLTLPDAPDSTHQQAMNELSKLTGTDFDRKFVDLMLDDHRNAVSLFENATKHVEDPDLHRYVVKTLPALRKHLQMAQDLKAGMVSLRP